MRIRGMGGSELREYIDGVFAFVDEVGNCVMGLRRRLMWCALYFMKNGAGVIFFYWVNDLMSTPCIYLSIYLSIYPPWIRS